MLKDHRWILVYLTYSFMQEIEKLVHPLVEKTPNVLGKTAEDVFMEQHKDLLEKREQWMKVTANSCMVVAALIATIMFAAAFTVCLKATKRIPESKFL